MQPTVDVSRDAFGKALGVRIVGNTHQDIVKSPQLLMRDGLATNPSDTTFWAVDYSSYLSPMQDGWASFERAAGESQYLNMFVANSGTKLVPNADYTVLVEWKDFANVNYIQIAQGSSNADPFASDAKFEVKNTPSGSRILNLRTKETISSTAYGLRLFLTVSTSATAAGTIRVTIVNGTKSSLQWEPYQSPVPTNPANIETVTGNVSVTANGAVYPLSLGSIKLNGFGGLSDYLHKENGEWYLHKETGYKTISASQLSAVNSYPGVSSYIAFGKSTDDKNRGTYSTSNCLYSHGIITNGIQWTSVSGVDNLFSGANNNSYWLGFRYGTSLDDVRALIPQSELYYELATPTETKITDQTLISQLDIIELAAMSLGISLKLEDDVQSELFSPLHVPLTESQQTGTSEITVLSGNIYTDFVYKKRVWSHTWQYMSAKDFEKLQAFYDRQFVTGKYPRVTILHLGVIDVPARMILGAREIVHNCGEVRNVKIELRESDQQ